MMQEELKKAMQHQLELIKRMDELEHQKDDSNENIVELCIELLDASSRYSALIQSHAKELIVKKREKGMRLW